MPIGLSWSRTCLSAAVLAATTVAAFAADPAPSAPASAGSLLERQTLTGDWFGRGQAMRDAGLDLRVEWSQFYQGLTSGNGAKHWLYAGKLDAQARIDLSKLGFWNGFSVTVQGTWNYGRTVNGVAGTVLPVNAAAYFPGENGSDASDIMALFVTQNFGDLVSVLAGKLNLVEFTRRTPLRGGGGVDTFWNVNLATPISGLSPPTIFGVQVRINTQPVSYSLTVFDAQDATNRPLFSNLFDKGVNVMGAATLTTSVAGRTGHYGIRGIYSTKEGPDLGEILLPPGTNVVNTKNGSYFVGISMQQFLVQDPSNPARGWGVFGEITKSDGNPNVLKWSTHVGVGGSGLIPGRPDDRFGIAYFRFGISEPLKTGLSPLFHLRDESGVELFYNWAATPWLRIAGNLQFIKPASGAFPDAIFAGLSTYVRF